MQRRSFLLGSAAALIGTAAGRVAAQVPPRRAFASLPLTGPDAPIGQEIARVLSNRLAESSPISVEILDDGGSTASMQSNYRMGLSAGADLLVGVLGRERGLEAVRVRSQLDRSTPIYVLGWPGAEPIPNVLNLRPSAAREGERIVSALADSGLRRIGLAYALTPSGRSLRDALVRAAERADLEVVAEVSTRDAGFAARRPRDTVTELRRRQVELMLSADSSVATARMFAAGREFEWSVPWVLTSVCSLPAIEQSLRRLSASASREDLISFRAFAPEARDRSDYLAARAGSPPSWPESVLPVELGEPGELGVEALAQADLVASTAAPAALSESPDGSDAETTAPQGVPAISLAAYRWSRDGWLPTSPSSPLMTSVGA